MFLPPSPIYLYIYTMNDQLLKELSYKTSRSSGPGGQHVNKTESRVELLWNIEESACLRESEKSLIKQRLKSRITDSGFLILASEKSRSQFQNKEDVTERFINLIRKSLEPVKKRKPTRPTKASKERRIQGKKKRGEVKKQRRGPDI
jgi:ribosome-associated protein